MINSISYITLRVKREGKKDLLYPFVEKFIENGGRQFSIRYMLIDGKAYPYFAFDVYIANQKDKKGNVFSVKAIKRFPTE